MGEMLRSSKSSSAGSCDNRFDWRTHGTHIIAKAFSQLVGPMEKHTTDNTYYITLIVILSAHWSVSCISIYLSLSLSICIFAIIANMIYEAYNDLEFTVAEECLLISSNAFDASWYWADLKHAFMRNSGCVLKSPRKIYTRKPQISCWQTVIPVMSHGKWRTLKLTNRISGQKKCGSILAPKSVELWILILHSLWVCALDPGFTQT